MATKTISSEAAWKMIDETLEQNYIAVPADGTDVYTKASDIPKDIKCVILFKEYHYMFMLEFMDNGEVVKTREDPRDTKGIMKSFYDLRNEVVSGELTSPNGESTLYEEHEYVDLGLPSGLKWAKNDVGRYAWAETIGKESFSKSNARKRTKFSDVKGDAKMDAARVHWGGKWRTPTSEEFQELVDTCKWQWRGWGYLLTGPNGKQIYLSACGYNESAWGPLNKKSEGYYWTTASKEGEDNATCLYFNKNERKLEWKESYMGMCVRPVFNDEEALPEVETPEVPVKDPEEYKKGMVNENGTLMEKYIFEGDSDWRTGNKASAAKKIKAGDYVELKFLGASEEKINIDEWNGVWEMNETITVMGENFYFEVVVNEKRAYYGKYATYRYIKESNTMGGGVEIEVTRTSLTEKEAHDAFESFKNWLSAGAKGNNYWHGLYKKTDFPEKISYGMPGEVPKPVEEKTWADGEIIDEGDGIFTVGGIRYELFDDSTYVDGKWQKTQVLKVLPLKVGEKYSGTVSIPGSVKYKRRNRTVTEVEREAFDDCPELTEVNLPSTITYFPSIHGSLKLERINVAEGNTKYRSLDGVLYSKGSRGSAKDGTCPELQCYPSARVGHFVMPDFVEYMAEGAFEDCRKLESIVLSDKLRWVPARAFKNCSSLKSISFPESVTSVDSDAFKGCSNIKSVTFAKGRYFYLDDLPKELFPWGKDAFVLDGVCYCPCLEHYKEGDALLHVCDFKKDDLESHIDASVQTVRIPARIERYGFLYKVSECGANFSQFPSLKRLELPKTVSKISISGIKTLQEVIVDGDNAEYSTKDGLLFDKQGTALISVPRGREVKKLVIPDGVAIIGVEACKGNSYVEELVIPDSTVKIEKGAFEECWSLQDVHLCKGLKKIGAGSFAYTGIERIVLPQSFAFTRQDRHDGKTPFLGSKLKEYALDGEHEMYTVIDGVLYIKNSSGLRLRYCPPAYEGHLQLPEEVNDIDTVACWGCSELTSVYIPDGVDYIGDDAFSGCTNLAKVEFDGHVRKIGSFCFSGCTSLKEIDCIGVSEIEDTAFHSDKGLKINLPYALEKNRSKYEQYMNR